MDLYKIKLGLVRVKLEFVSPILRNTNSSFMQVKLEIKINLV